MSILSKIQTGKIGRAQKCVIYGPEGFGKSTLASLLPSPLFLDMEDSTSQLSVSRLTRAELPDLAAFESALAAVAKEKPCATLVVDTVDWLEDVALTAIIAEAASPKIKGIEDFGYGKGYTVLRERMAILLSRFDAVIKAGIHVVLLAHSKVAKFEPPDGAGAYDRYELKLSKQVSPLVKEWADMVVFGNWRTQIAEKGRGDETKYKGVGGRERQMHCNRSSAWDAKNRHGMADVEKWEIATLERAFKSANAPWISAVPEAKSAGAVADKLPSALLENVHNAGEVAAKIVAELKPDEIPMHFDEAGKGIVSPEEIEFHRLCEPHQSLVNAFLLAGKRIQAGQTFRDVPPEYRTRVLKNPAGFLKAALAGGAK